MATKSRVRVRSVTRESRVGYLHPSGVLLKALGLALILTDRLFARLRQQLSGVKRSGVKRSGVQRSGVQRSGVQRSGVQRSGVATMKSDDVTTVQNSKVCQQRRAVAWNNAAEMWNNDVTDAVAPPADDAANSREPRRAVPRRRRARSLAIAAAALPSAAASVLAQSSR